MPTNAIPGAEVFSFNGVDYHGALQQLMSTDEQRTGEHEILKRRGAIIEGMEWKAARYVATLAFVGPNFRADVLALRTRIRDNSEGPLVHPLYGRVNARCVKIDGALNIPREANGAAVTLNFVEAGVDAQATATLSQTVPSKALALENQSESFATSAAVYTSSDAVSASAALADAALAFATAASDAVTLGVTDPSLVALVGNIETAAVAAILAIEADAAASVDVDRFDAIASADLVYAAALDLYSAFALARPVLAPYTVPSAIGYLTLAGQFYGSDGIARADEIIANNPTLITPHLIPAGTVLMMAPATV